MRKAFTLVELLVAVVLLTLLIGTALFSYRQVLLNITKAERSTFDEVLKVHQIRTSIESMQHYVVDDYNQFNQPMKRLHMFFYGNEHSFKYVSLSPIYSTMPTLSEFSCRENKLIYREEPMYKRIDVSRPDFVEESHSMSYWHNIEDCQFHYFFYKNFHSELAGKLPTAIQIYFKDSHNQVHTIFTTIKSDYNISSSILYEYLYGE